MPIAVSNSSSAEIWNNSSRGKVSRILSRVLPSWLSGVRPARSIVRRTFCRNSGIECGLLL